MTLPRSLAASRTRPLYLQLELSLKGVRVVRRIQDKCTWFVDNIAATHPKVESRRTQNRLRKARRPLSARTDAQSTVKNEKIVPTTPVRSHTHPPRILRSSRMTKRSRSAREKVQQGEEDPDSDAEDYGQPCSITHEDSARSGFTHYYSAASHLSALHGAGPGPSLPVVDEDSAVMFTDFCEGPIERSLSDLVFTLHDSESSFSNALVYSGAYPSGIPDSSSAPTPSIVLTMPTPQISQSPIFQPRSPISLAKYVQATTLQPSPALSVSSGVLSPSPVPSIPSCDRSCLAQLEEGLICRSCQRQWLACKMWYHANDGGRRRWLTEPLIRPAESTASVRALMGVLGVPGNIGTVGLGLETSVKKLPFKVITTAGASGVSRGCSTRAVGWRRALLEATKNTVDTVFTMFSLQLKALLSGSPTSCSSTGIPDLSLATSRDCSTASWATRIAPHRQPHLPRARSPSYGTSLSALACITSSSRFIEHIL